MVEINEITDDNNNNDDDDDDDDDHHHHQNNKNDNPNSPSTTMSNIQLGFSEPLDDDDSSSTRRMLNHRSPRWWRDWDGGSIGGRPSWLQPERIPDSAALICRECRKPLSFIGQLYVPLDHTPSAFHRSFYIFACPACCCRCGSGGNHNDNNKGGIRVLRVQLPRENPYYPLETSSITVLQNWNRHLPNYWNVPLCRVCGIRAKGKCPIQQEWFCGTIHQKEYKKYFSTSSKQQQDVSCMEDTKLIETTTATAVQDVTKNNSTTVATATDPIYLPSVYPESELVVDEEPPVGGYDDDEEEEDYDDDDEIEARPAMIPASPNNNYQQPVNVENITTSADDHDSDEDLEQDDLNEMITGTNNNNTSTRTKKDPVTDAFYRRIHNRKVPEQCLRYTMEWRRKYDVSPSQSENSNDNDNDSGNDDKDAGLNSTSNTNDDDDDDNNQNDSVESKQQQQQDDSQPLWIRSDHRPAHIPPCPYCHAPRAFEFQLMPQMLNFLQNNNTKNNNNNNNKANRKKEMVKQAVMKAETIIANTDPSMIPPSFADAKINAMKALKDELTSSSTSSTTKSTNNKTNAAAHPTIDWGVVAIYTCTKSCSGDIDDGDENKDDDDVEKKKKPSLGVYREEFAWVQPAMEL